MTVGELKKLLQEGKAQPDDEIVVEFDDYHDCTDKVDILLESRISEHDYDEEIGEITIWGYFG